MKALSLITLAALLCACSQAGSHKATATDTPAAEDTKPVATTFVESDLTCPHYEVREVYFTSAKQPDTLDISVIGNDCDTSVIELKVIAPSGEQAYASSARTLDYINDGRGPSAVKFILSHLVWDGTLPSPEQFSEDFGYFEINHDAAEIVRTQALPLLCLTGGKSFKNCFAYIDGASTFLFSTGS